MECYNIFSLILLFFADQLIDSLSALEADNIIGGYLAREKTFMYHVAIQGRSNFTDEYTELCGGGVINEYFVLSAGSCFINSTGDLIEKSFSIVALSISFLHSKSTRINVHLIYLPGFDKEFVIYNIAVLKLERKLNIPKSERLSKVPLPSSGESFKGEIGIITGYGYNWVIKTPNGATGHDIIIDGDTSSLLTFAPVKILSDEDCNHHNPEGFVFTQMCGIVIPKSRKNSWGNCKGDVGNPLIVNDKFAGIVSKINHDCDDTVHACVYTKVSSFVSFIEKVMLGIVEGSTIVLSNPRHILSN